MVQDIGHFNNNANHDNSKNKDSNYIKIIIYYIYKVRFLYMFFLNAIFLSHF
jgi:hypothetical protein